MSDSLPAPVEPGSEEKPAAATLTLVGSEDVVVCVGDSCYLPSAVQSSDVG